MTLQEVLKELGLEGSYEEQCKQYAEMLDSGYVLGVFPEELTGNDSSPDGKWSWSKKTGFINKFENNVDFNDILCIFDDPLPVGCFIINHHFDYSSKYERDRILARIAKRKFVDVRVNYEYHKIYSAKEVSRKQIDREISQLVINSSVNYFEQFLDMYETEDGKAVISKTSFNILSWVKMYRNFIKSSFSEDNIFMALYYGMGIPAEESEWFIHEWKKGREREERFREMESEEEKYDK